MVHMCTEKSLELYFFEYEIVWSLILVRSPMYPDNLKVLIVRYKPKNTFFRIKLLNTICIELTAVYSS